MASLDDIAKDYENLPESMRQLLESAIVLGAGKKVENAEKICNHPETEIHDVQQQLMPTLPPELFTSIESPIPDYKRQINDYRHLYEQHAQKINLLISQTKIKIRKYYKPLQEFKKEIEKENQNLNNTINSLIEPLKNKIIGVDDINIENIQNELRNQFIIDKKEIDDDFIKFKTSSEEYSKEYSKLTTDKMKEINNFVDMFLELAGPAQTLSKIIEECFKFFEDECENLEDEDLYNPEKMNTTLEKIRKKINDKFNNEMSDKSEVEQVAKKLKDLEELNSLNNVNYKETINKMKKICEELEKQSEKINEKIIAFRKKYNQKPVRFDKSKITLEIPGNLSEELRKEVTALVGDIMDLKKSQIDIVIKIKSVNLEANNLLKLDILLIMDITNSMSDYLNQIKEQVINIKKLIEKRCPNITLRIGFIGYKDYLDYQFDHKSYVNLGLTTDFDNIKNGIQDIVAGGGSDVPEDLAWAMDKAVKQKWEAQSKFTLLVTDAPCHGGKYHQLGVYDKINNALGDDDYYLKKTNIDIEECVKFLAKNEIYFYCLKITELTNKMFMMFEEIYNENKPPNSKSIFKIENDSAAKNLPQLIVDAVINIFKDRKELSDLQNDGD